MGYGMINILSICLGVVSIMSGINFDSVQKAIMSADSVKVSMSQNEYVIDRENVYYTIFNDFVEKILDGSHQVPALGVAINDEVLKEKENKNWIEFNFKELCECDGLNFESLLVFLEKDMGGVNVYRKINGEYSGRCFYINLGENVSEIFDVLG